MSQLESVTMEPTGVGRLMPLPVAARVFEELTAAGIPHCHWKSNWHLLDGLRGETDLDLLVDPEHRATFESVLERHGFVRVLSPRLKRFAGLADFIGFDGETGGLIHLHVHYRLVLGEQRVKNHHLPVEGWVLTDRRELHGVSVPAAEVELVLLYLRAHLKVELRALLRNVMGRQPFPVPQAIRDELVWLLGQASDAEALAALARSGLTVSALEFRSFLAQAREGDLPPFGIWRRKRSLLRQLREYQQYPTIVCVARKAWYRIRYSRPVRRVRPVSRKRLPSGGLYLAVVGADGSGKTTLSRDLVGWLGWKLETELLYLGIPRDDLVLRVLRKSRRIRGSTGIAPVIEAVEWLYLARRRLALDRRARRFRGEGGIAIAERFPLREFWTMQWPMDGPRLSTGARGRVLRALAWAERRTYERIDTPDLVLVLRAGLEVLRIRKSDLDLETHRRKVEAVDGLGNAGDRRVLDAELPYPALLLDAKRAIWSTIGR